ncbi:MAG TPA: helix-turn-helix domain-containing protein [Chloroflexota bacterium]|nr:helix-turn-helix domain-containing protein [Chloroflexota bacterium]
MATTIRPETLDTLARLERELAAEGRTAEVEAVREALSALARPERGLLTTGQAAKRLGVSVTTVKEWVKRGTLKGADTGTRWLVSEESVERILRIRKSVAEMEEEGYPTPEEVHELTKRVRRQMASEKKAAGA